ncbi:unnamed protein product [Pleuronectes platessa]|uniref:Secreted protein n=1 Tax=Pleuronectes platessa TaxID=8262 RepID=A0A9N7YHJ5_PLEPL|nr:unnamed protein product [Pleuronectes platessa]
MSAGVSLAPSLALVAVAAAAEVVVVVEEAVVHLEPAERIPADVTSRGVIGRQGGTTGTGGPHQPCTAAFGMQTLIPAQLLPPPPPPPSILYPPPPPPATPSTSRLLLPAHPPSLPLSLKASL